jgi:hypothetical protein
MLWRQNLEGYRPAETEQSSMIWSDLLGGRHLAEAGKARTVSWELLQMWRLRRYYFAFSASLSSTDMEMTLGAPQLVMKYLAATRQRRREQMDA